MATPSHREEAVIVKATLEDVPQIKEMVNSAYSKYIDRIGKPPAPMTEDYDLAVRTSPVFALKEDGGKVVGAIVVSECPVKGTMGIKNLVVDPKTQGRGYGRALMRHAEEIAVSKGLFALELYTNVKMHENLRFYEGLGFSEIGRGVEDGFERIYFRKELSQN